MKCNFLHGKSYKSDDFFEDKTEKATKQEAVLIGSYAPGDSVFPKDKSLTRRANAPSIDGARGATAWSSEG